MTQTENTTTGQHRDAAFANASRAKLWFGLLGGAFAWLTHLMVAYTAAEFGCVGSLPDSSFAGISPVAWLILGVSIITLLVAIAATASAWRDDRRLATSDAIHPGARYAARAGWITSGLFALVILVETLPIFYYLRDC